MFAGSAGLVVTSLSFTIPLSSELEEEHGVAVTVEQVAKAEVPSGCTVGGVQGSAANPLAAPGYLCVYAAAESENAAGEKEIEYGSGYFPALEKASSSEKGVSTTGAVLELIAKAANANAHGSWAVTAPEA